MTYLGKLTFHYRIWKYFTMAFVFSEPRWTRNCGEETPGPGAHCPELVRSSPKKIEQVKRLRKGKAFIRDTRQQPSPEPRSPTKQAIPPPSQAPRNSKHPIHKPKSTLPQTQIHQAKNPLFPANKFIQVFKLQPGVFLDIDSNNGKDLCSENNKEKEEISLAGFQNFQIKKTAASIRPVYPEKFYIGSRDQQIRRKSTNMRKDPSTQKQKKLRTKSSLNNRRMEKQTPEQALMTQKLQSESPPKQKTHKPISAKHPFHKNEQLYQQESSKYEEKSTGIQEEESELSQFVADVVPGPGTYQPGDLGRSTKKGLMFTEVKKARFQPPVRDDKVGYEFIYNPVVQTRKSKSRASQRKVGFGRTMTAKGAAQPVEQQEEIPQFCDTKTGTIESKCMKIKLKDALAPGFFTSKVPRFPCPQPKLSASTLRADLKKQQHLAKIKKQFSDHKLSHPFSSAVARQQSISPLTSCIDYSGQQHKTIHNSLKQLMSQPKYFYQAIEASPLQEDLASEPIFKEDKNKKHVKTDIEIRYQLVQNLYGFRQRENRVLRRNQIKGYTFSQGERVEATGKENRPDPTQYYKETAWVKNSFNTKFAPYREESRDGERDREQEQTAIRMANQAINLKILRI